MKGIATAGRRALRILFIESINAPASERVCLRRRTCRFAARRVEIAFSDSRNRPPCASEWGIITRPGPRTILAHTRHAHHHTGSVV
jgi:hypothetical protein